jgi:hypothetical protein
MFEFLLQPLAWFVTRRYLYHLDKIAHTAVLTLLLAALATLAVYDVRLTHCAIWAALMYFVVGKVIWYTSASYRRYADGPIRPSLDWLSDFALSWCVVLLAATYEGYNHVAIVSLLAPACYLTAVALRRTSP